MQVAEGLMPEKQLAIGNWQIAKPFTAKGAKDAKEMGPRAFHYFCDLCVRCGKFLISNDNQANC